MKTSSKLAWAGELMLIEARWTDKDGCSVKFRLVSPNESRPNPFKVFTKRRGGKGGTIFVASMRGVAPNTPGYDGEVVLLGWGDTNSQGYTVSFAVEETEDGHHPFNGCSRLVHSWMVALAEMSDDGEAVDQAQRERVEGESKKETADSTPQEQKKRRGQLLSQASALLCGNPSFWEWINETQLGSSEPRIFTVHQAADWMRDKLDIDSRKDLDTMELKAARYHAEIRRPFLLWVDQESRVGDTIRRAGAAAVNETEGGAVGFPGDGRASFP